MKFRNAAALMLTVAMLAGCTSQGNAGNAPTQTTQATTAATEAAQTEAADTEAAAESEKEAETTAAETTAEETTAAETAAPEEKKDLARSGEVRDIKPAELVAELKIGWNLGNSLDATGNSGVLTEMAWGNPKTTQEMIDAINEKGFNTIRIPVTWDGHLGAAPDYKIDEKWMERVQEVVNYAIDDDMYVILDSHHEENWRIPDDAHIDEVCKEVSAIWTQIAENFKDYGDHLILEGLNEPRVKGSPEEWSGGKPEGWRCVDQMNQAFIDAVRSTGGNNEKRLLLVTTYASSSVNKAMMKVTIPEDEHIAFSIHAYTPYAFTYANGESWELFDWDGSRDGEIDALFSDLKKYFLDKGIPVILTEFGAVNKNGNDAEVANWVTKYLTTAKENGVPCVWWDNGYYTSGNELFGIFDRHNCTWFTDTVVDAMMKVYE